MTDTVTISEPITSVTVSDSVTSVTISSSTPSYDVTITNGAAFTAALNDLTDVTLTSPSNNQVLAYNSSTSQWVNATSSGGSGSPGGSDTQVQFNDSGSFGGDAGLTYNKTTDTLTIAGGLVVDSSTLYVDSTNNRVGIGLTNPSYPLEVKSASSNNIVFRTRASDDVSIFEVVETAAGNGQILVKNTSGATELVLTSGSASAINNVHGLIVGGAQAALDTTALLQVDSTTRGFLPPRQTTTQRDAISTPAQGLTVFNTTSSTIDVYDGSSWDSLGTGSVTSVSIVSTNGISGTVATSTTTPAISLSLGAITPSTITTNSVQFDTETNRNFLLREETQFTGYTPYTLGLSYNDSGADTTSAFILYGGGSDTMDLWVYDGSCWFGNSGSSAAPDTRLFRSAANTLRTDDSFIVDGSLTSSTLTVSSANATISGYLRVGSNTAPNNTVAGDITGVRLSLGNSAFGTDQIFRIASTLVSTANGAISFATFDPTFSPTANSLTDFRTLNFGARVSTSSGITMDNIEGIHVEGARFGATADGQVASIGGLFGQGVVTDTTATSNISVTSVYGIKGMAGGKGSGSGIITSTSMYGGLFGVTESASTMVTTNGFGIAVVNPSSGTTVTNLYGIDVAGQTRGSTGNFGIRVGLSSGATTNAAIQLSDTTGVVGGGILFGTDTTLYRSAADTLKTDDAFIANTVTLLSDDAYSSSWNGSLAVATKNAIYDKIETLTSGASNSFATIAVSGQSDVVADSSTDTLTLVAGSNITITTDASTDTITITGTGGGSGITRSVNVISTPTTAGSTAATDYVYFVSGTTTLTLPTAVGNTNRYTVKNTGSNTVTIATTASQTIDGSATASLPVANTSLDLVSDGSNWQVV